MELIWNEWNTEHIKKHNVSVDEVEEVYKSKKITKQSYLDRNIILGKTKKRKAIISGHIK